ncbi:MAG: zinc metalloprotease [Kiloniellales bacterium]|nr:zinc metalloprotease [Kiloniellales bacterium]
MQTYNIGGYDYDDFESFGRRCGCSRPSYVKRNQVDAKLREFRSANAAFRDTTGNIHIPIKFIHLTDGAAGVVNAQQREDQVRVLNTAYRLHGIVFTHSEADVEEVNNADWFRMGHDSAAERAAKTALQTDPETTLNFYTTNGGGLLGWATFPWDLAGDPVMDGVVVLFSSLPEIGPPPYNLGQTATHEVGHWLGLYHTFQGGCSATGDHVGDTVPHSGPNFGKPEVGLRHNACNPGDAAPVQNYMNYVDDDWMDRFTDQQVARMKDMIGTFRPEVLQNEESDPGLYKACTRVQREL